MAGLQWMSIQWLAKQTAGPELPWQLSSAWSIGTDGSWKPLADVADDYTKDIRARWELVLNRIANRSERQEPKSFIMSKEDAYNKMIADRVSKSEWGISWRTIQAEREKTPFEDFNYQADFSRKATEDFKKGDMWWVMKNLIGQKLAVAEELSDDVKNAFNEWWKKYDDRKAKLDKYLEEGWTRWLVSNELTQALLASLKAHSDIFWSLLSAWMNTVAPWSTGALKQILKDTLNSWIVQSQIVPIYKSSVEYKNEFDDAMEKIHSAAEKYWDKEATWLVDEVMKEMTKWVARNTTKDRIDFIGGSLADIGSAALDIGIPWAWKVAWKATSEVIEQWVKYAGKWLAKMEAKKALKKAWEEVVEDTSMFSKQGPDLTPTEMSRRDEIVSKGVSFDENYVKEIAKENPYYWEALQRIGEFKNPKGEFDPVVAKDEFIIPETVKELEKVYNEYVVPTRQLLAEASNVVRDKQAWDVFSYIGSINKSVWNAVQDITGRKLDVKIKPTITVRVWEEIFSKAIESFNDIKNLSKQTGLTEDELLKNLDIEVSGLNKNIQSHSEMIDLLSKTKEQIKSWLALGEDYRQRDSWELRNIFSDNGLNSLYSWYPSDAQKKLGYKLYQAVNDVKQADPEMKAVDYVASQWYNNPLFTKYTKPDWKLDIKKIDSLLRSASEWKFESNDDLIFLEQLAPETMMKYKAYMQASKDYNKYLSWNAGVYRFANGAGFHSVMSFLKWSNAMIYWAALNFPALVGVVFAWKAVRKAESVIWKAKITKIANTAKEMSSKSPEAMKRAESALINSMQENIKMLEDIVGMETAWELTREEAVEKIQKVVVETIKKDKTRLNDFLQWFDESVRKDVAEAIGVTTAVWTKEEFEKDKKEKKFGLERFGSK